MRALPALLALLLSVQAASALDETGREAARAAISRQVEALGRDDAAGAYAQAAPSIQAMFPNADLFLGMVRNGYAPVYRHRSFAFGDVTDADEARLTQDVRIQDEQGVDWTAHYSVERQPDGSWRITGCRLTKLPGTNT
ncbi:DUF4864 domain-containing protein [Methylobacterium sp. sgz302541]|uniref:DUF4864 domain-containing protein n=1 Tax=unclassified Methylobacterium TaxID=2615210 RepID=UPI003D34AE6C